MENEEENNKNALNGRFRVGFSESYDLGRLYFKGPN